LARIASTADEFVDAAEQAMAFKMGMKWRERADAFLETMSWDAVWFSMQQLVEEVLDSRRPKQEVGTPTLGEMARV
jgi:hypothetical protein